VKLLGTFRDGASGEREWDRSWEHALALTGGMLTAILAAAILDALIGAGQATERYARPFPSALRDEFGVAGRTQVGR